MGKPIKRLNPKIKTKVDRNIKELSIKLIAFGYFVILWNVAYLIFL